MARAVLCTVGEPVEVPMRGLLVGCVLLLGCTDNGLAPGGGGDAGGDLSSSDLAGADFAGVDFSGVDFAGPPVDLAGGGNCPMTCGPFFQCCGGQCINPQNDPFNCNGCGNACPGANPFCGNGVCGQPPCPGGNTCLTGFCCGSTCCNDGQLCCLVNGPGPTGPPTCFTPTAAQPTCPRGCPACQ
jgi:hypothetical protein